MYKKLTPQTRTSYSYVLDSMADMLWICEFPACTAAWINDAVNVICNIPSWNSREADTDWKQVWSRDIWCDVSLLVCISLSAVPAGKRVRLIICAPLKGDGHCWTWVTCTALLLLADEWGWETPISSEWTHCTLHTHSEEHTTLIVSYWRTSESTRPREDRGKVIQNRVSIWR